METIAVIFGIFTLIFAALWMAERKERKRNFARWVLALKKLSGVDFL